MFFYGLCLLMSFVAFAADDAVPSLQALCAKTVLKEKLDYSILPPMVKELVRNEKDLLDRRLNSVVLMRRHPNEVQKLLDQGASPNWPYDPSCRTMLEIVTSNSYPSDNVYDYQGKKRSHSAVVGKMLIGAGATYTQESFFNVARTSNLELFEAIQEEYFPDEERRKYSPNGTGYYIRADDAWKDMTNGCGQTLFHMAAARPSNVDFCKEVFGKYAVWRHLLKKNEYGKTVVDILYSSPEAEKVALARTIDNCRVNHSLILMANQTEAVIDLHKDAWEYIKSTDVGARFVHNCWWNFGWNL